MQKRSETNNVHRLIRNQVSTDTVRCLTTLLEQARMGRLTGVAYVAYLSDAAYIAGSAGEAHKRPVTTRGMLLDLDAKLALRTSEGIL